MVVCASVASLTPHHGHVHVHNHHGHGRGSDGLAVHYSFQQASPCCCRAQSRGLSPKMNLLMNRHRKIRRQREACGICSTLRARCQHFIRLTMGLSGVCHLWTTSCPFPRCRSRPPPIECVAALRAQREVGELQREQRGAGQAGGELPQSCCQSLGWPFAGSLSEKRPWHLNSTWYSRLEDGWTLKKFGWWGVLEQAPNRREGAQICRGGAVRGGIGTVAEQNEVVGGVEAGRQRIC